MRGSIMSATARRRLIPIIAGGVVLVLLVVGVVVFLTRDPAPDTAVQVQTPQSVATDFATAFAAGDTPTACALTSGDALQAMTGKGWCTGTQTWNETAGTGQHCERSDGMFTGGATVYEYTTTGPVYGHTQLWVAVSGQPPKVTVIGVTNPGDANFCSST